MVGRHEHLRFGELAEVWERVPQDESVGVDGEAIHAGLCELEDEVHLVQAELAKVLRAPAVVLGCQAGRHEEGRDASSLQPSPRLIVERTDEVVGLLQRDEVADQCEGKVEPVVVDVRGDQHVVLRGVLLR